VNRMHRIRHASEVSGWGQPLPGWSPLVDHGPLPVRVAGSVARWWWPTLAIVGFLAVVVSVTSNDHPGPGLSQRGLLAIALAALVVVLLTIHRTAGPGPLVRAVAEYAVVAVLAGLLVAGAGGVDQPPTNPTSSEAERAATATPNLDAGEDRRPGVLRVAAGVIRAVTGVVQAVTGAVGWLIDLWRQADQQTDRPSRSPSTTTPQPKGEAIGPSPAPPLSTGRPL
jgi:hypothetical protein